ncbi:hypothetical protein PR048_026016 [Dryococelus australis]|uniref:Uncharacterized protein n=1 Tax=Dryococelus australis TaxID=614101 RepID=A0ABQ9GK78_9NEOP|nr:hypothetical protein PR048_026016 [Dryococelus australis]
MRAKRDPREYPPTSGIIRNHSHMLKSGYDPASNRARGFVRVQGQEVREQYGRHEYARLAPRRSYAQGVQCFRRGPFSSTNGGNPYVRVRSIYRTEPTRGINRMWKNAGGTLMRLQRGIGTTSVHIYRVLSEATECNLGDIPSTYPSEVHLRPDKLGKSPTQMDTSNANVKGDRTPRALLWQSGEYNTTPSMPVLIYTEVKSRQPKRFAVYHSDRENARIHYRNIRFETPIPDIWNKSTPGSGKCRVHLAWVQGYTAPYTVITMGQCRPERWTIHLSIHSADGSVARSAGRCPWNVDCTVARRHEGRANAHAHDRATLVTSSLPSTPLPQAITSPTLAHERAALIQYERLRIIKAGPASDKAGGVARGNGIGGEEIVTYHKRPGCEGVASPNIGSLRPVALLSPGTRLPRTSFISQSEMLLRRIATRNTLHSHIILILCRLKVAIT